LKIDKGELITDRFRVPYRVYRSTEDMIVCVSGAKQTMAVWRTFISHFIDNYSVVVFDQPGQGRAEILDGPEAVSFDEQVAVLNDIVERTSNSRPVYLAAASWGTLISLAYAALYPEKVKKMILGSFGARPTAYIKDLINKGMQLIEENRYADLGLLVVNGFGSQVPEGYKKQILGQFENVSREQMEVFYRHCEFVMQAEDVSSYIDLGNVGASTLIINGEKDRMVDYDHVLETSSRIPNCETRLVPGAGHFLHWENAAILGTYSQFFSR